MRIVFMGTPQFAVPSLEAIISAGHEVVGVFTQPDRPQNRGKKIIFTPVKESAIKHGIPVFQPESLKKGESAEEGFNTLKALAPECIVVAAYGQILPEHILNLPEYGCINVHASLLPKYRGAAPIQWCIVHGEKKTGITTMHMAKGLDTGDMILKSEVEITDDMTGSQLHDMLCDKGGELIVKTLEQLKAGIAPREPQDDSLSCYAPMISKEILKVDFSKPAVEVRNFIRAMADKPCAYSFLDGKRLKIYEASLVEGEYDEQAGTLIDLSKFIVVCGDRKALALTNIQLEGCRQMSSEECMRGRRVELGTILG